MTLPIFVHSNDGYLQRIANDLLIQEVLKVNYIFNDKAPQIESEASWFDENRLNLIPSKFKRTIKDPLVSQSTLAKKRIETIDKQILDQIKLEEEERFSFRHKFDCEKTGVRLYADIYDRKHNKAFQI